MKSIIDFGIRRDFNIGFKHEAAKPDPNCRWCKGTGEVTLATSTKPCLDCLTPYEGWVWDDIDHSPTVFYADADGNEVEVHGVAVGSGKTPPGATNVGRLSRFIRPGRGQGEGGVKKVLPDFHGERFEKLLRGKTSKIKAGP